MILSGGKQVIIGLDKALAIKLLVLNLPRWFTCLWFDLRLLNANGKSYIGAQHSKIS